MYIFDNRNSVVENNISENVYTAFRLQKFQYEIKRIKQELIRKLLPCATPCFIETPPFQLIYEHYGHEREWNESTREVLGTWR